MKTQLILTILVFLFTLGACKHTRVEPDNPKDKKTKKTITLGEKSQKLVQADNTFGLELFQEIYSAEKKTDNLMVSPLSVSLALAMTYNGANNATKKAMEKTLKLSGLSKAEINQSCKTLIDALKSVDSKVQLDIANAIFYRIGFMVEDSFISANENYYNAETAALDFNSTEDALRTINNWVADKTNDKIEKILDNISSEQLMFLLNAIYFHGKWATRFNKDDTEELPFYLEDGNSIKVPTMKKSEALPYYSNDLFRSVKLSYGSGNYNLFIFLPKSGKTTTNIVEQLTDENWTNWMSNFNDSVNIDLELPKFKYGYEIKLNDVLSAMGMRVAFSPKADFTGINKGGGLYIDIVKHKTFIEVDEEGTEAAAVTIVGIFKTSAEADPNLEFKVNRPFFYAITEEDTGAVIFMGTVKNPKNKG